MTHSEFLCSILRSVRADGAAATLEQVRTERPAFQRGRYHDTRAVFFVWAVDRLVGAGLSDAGVLWHPLTAEGSAGAWWTPETLASDAAHDGFVRSELALAHEPQPAELGFLIAA